MKSEFQKLIENTSEKYLKDMATRFQDDQRKASQKLAMVKKELKRRKKHDTRI